MKYSLRALLIISIFLSCKSNTKKSLNDSSVITVSTNNDPQKLIKEFAPIIQGVWINKEYIDKVTATKSPLAAIDKARGLTEFIIDTAKITGDSLIVKAGWYNHDGSDTWLKFKSGKSNMSVLFNAGELTYSVNKNDTILIYSVYDDEQKKNTVTKFKRITRTVKELGLQDALDLIINKSMISGNYKFTDSTGKSNKVVLYQNGVLKGLPPYKTYRVNADLNNEPMNNLDELSFDPYSKEQKSYTFKIIADTLKLYDTRPNADSSELVLDKLVYKLIRIK